MDNETYMNPGEHSFQTSGAPDMGGTYIVDRAVPSHCGSHSNSCLCEITDILYEAGDQYAAMQYCMDTDDYFDPIGQYLPENFGLHSVSNNDETMFNVKGEGMETPTQDARSTGALFFEAQGEQPAYGAASEALLMSNSDIKGLNVNCNVLPSKSCFDRTDGRLDAKMASTKLSPHTLSNLSSRKQGFFIKNEKNGEPFASKGTSCRSIDSVDGRLSTNRGLRQSLSSTLTSISRRNQVVKDEKEDVFVESKRARNSHGNVDETCINPTTNRSHGVLGPKPSTSIRKQLACLKEEIESKLPHVKATNSLIISHQAVKKSNSWVPSYDVDDDSDICILENLSQPARQNLSAVNEKSIVTVQTNSFSGSPNQGGAGGPNHVGAGSVKLKTNDERFIFRVALQVSDLLFICYICNAVLVTYVYYRVVCYAESGVYPLFDYAIY